MCQNGIQHRPYEDRRTRIDIFADQSEGLRGAGPKGLEMSCWMCCPHWGTMARLQQACRQTALPERCQGLAPFLFAHGTRPGRGTHPGLRSGQT